MRLRLFCAAMALGLAACHNSGTSAIEKMGADQLFARGEAELKAHHWDNAIEAFDRLTLQYPSFARVQQARLDLAEAYLGKGDAVTAAGEFDRLSTDYPLGAYADNARYMVCHSYEMLSPRVQLDQTYTQSAIDHCNSLIAYYPNSPFTPQAREVVSRLTEKLAEKELLAGNYYFKRHAYDSSLIYFEDVVKTYPATNSAADALLQMAYAYDKLGYKEDADSARARLLKDYPGSPAAKVLKPVVNTAQTKP